MDNITKSDLDIVVNKIASTSLEDNLSLPIYRCEERTHYDPVRLSHNWMIDNFRSILTSSQQKLCIKSKIFSSEIIPDIQWRMCIFPRGGNLGGNKNGFLFMEITSTSHNKKLSFKAKHKYIIRSHVFGVNDWHSDLFINTISLHPDNPTLRCSIFCIPLCKIDGYLYGDGAIEIYCEMLLVPNEKGKFCKIEAVEYPEDGIFNYKNYLSQFYKMYKSSDQVDCSIICEEKVFKVHKFMLITHSPVFYAMFKHTNTKESEEQCVNIVGSSLHGVEMMIDYIYTGEIPDLISIDETIDLLNLADKYDIKQLHILCQDRLIFFLSEVNACDLLKVSELYKAKHLMNACIRLISRNLAHITTSEEWLEMEQTHSQLAIYVLKNAVNHK